jgi:hypothetical protein
VKWKYSRRTTRITRITRENRKKGENGSKENFYPMMIFFIYYSLFLFTFLLLNPFIFTNALHCNVCPNQPESACSYLKTDNFKAFPSSQLTFEGWIWLGDDLRAGLVEYQAQNSLGQTSSMFAVGVTSKSVHVTVRGNNAVIPLPSGHAKALEAQKWSHVAVTWEATKAVLQVFINGLPTEDASSQLLASKNLFMQSGGSFRLGRYNDTLAVTSTHSPSNSEINLLQEVRLWSTALGERHISQTLRKTSMPSYTGIVAHWRLWGNSSTDLFDLAQDASGNDRSLSVVGHCDSDLLVDTTSMPGAYELINYNFVPLLGLGMASGKQYALDVGNEIQISSFGDGNVVECSNGQKITLQNQGIGTMSSIQDGDYIQGIEGVQAVGTRQPPQMPLVPRSFQGTVFALPNIRGVTLYLTVKSLADDLSEAEADDASSGLSSETVIATSNNINTMVINKVSNKCLKVTPIDIQGTDEQAGSYRLTKVMDNDPDSWWRLSCASSRLTNRALRCTSSNKHWYAETEFATKVIVDRYFLSVSTGGRSKNYYPQDWTIEASDDGVNWIIISTQTNVRDWEYQERRSFWGTDATATTRPIAYKYWRFHCTRVYNNGYYIQIAEIEFQTCGSDLTSGTHAMNNGGSTSNAVTIDLNKEDVLSFSTTNTNPIIGASSSVNLEVMSGRSSWAYTQSWKCTTSSPPWYWTLPEFDDSSWGSVPTMINSDNIGLGGNLTLNGINDQANGQQWCRSALANQPDVLTLWDSRYGNVDLLNLFAISF